MIRILHFADAHIDIAAQGRHDPESGLPIRMLDFLKSLDTIVDTAIAEKVDLVIFAGDAYKDRTPVPTYQREWGKRIIRLSQAGIPTLLLVGNHDVSPAAYRANTLQEYETLQVPHVIVVNKPCLLGPDQLEGLPLQIIALPWITRSGLLSQQENIELSPEKVSTALEDKIDNLVKTWVEDLNPSLPAVLTAHGSVAGAVYGAERSVMLGSDIILPGSMVKNPVFSYTALGLSLIHI
jgi:exonuclease SbcD